PGPAVMSHWGKGLGAPRCVSLRSERVPAHFTDALFPSPEVLALPCPFGNFFPVPSRLNFLCGPAERARAAQFSARRAALSVGYFGARGCPLARRPRTRRAQK